jgi:hypothetical protein
MKTGDIITSSIKLPWFRIFRNLGLLIVRAYQKKIGLKKYNDNHIVLITEKGIFSTQPPRAIMIKINEYFNQKNTIYSVYRYNGNINNEQKENITKEALKLIGRKYDFGQLINILWNGLILNTPKKETIHNFDLSFNRKVCSDSICYIFRKVGINIFKNYDCQMVTPAHFSNSNDYKLIKKIKT